MIKHIHVSECDSTQDLLKEQLSQFTDEHKVLVSCDNQLNGRGRGEHLWTSMPGSLCFSLSLDPHPVPSFTAIEVSVLIAKFFEGSILNLKWPNDIWNKHKKKCCGVLAQSHNKIMIAGIGINLHSDRPEFGGIYDTSFYFDKNSWSFEIANFILENRYQSDVHLRRDWEKMCRHMGEMVCVSEGTEVTEGIFRGLGAYGEAIIETPLGERRLLNGSLSPYS